MAIEDEIKPAELKPTSTSSHEVADKVNSHVHLKLIPRPSDSPRDPFNWPLWKKVGTLAVVSYAAFVGAAQAACNASDQVVHARSYPGTTPIDESHTVSAHSSTETRRLPPHLERR